LTVNTSKPNSHSASGKEKKKPGDKWTGLVVVLVFGFLLALYAASFGPYYGAATMLAFIVAGHWATPKKWRKLYRLLIIASAIALFFGTIIWEQWITDLIRDSVFAIRIAAFLLTFGLSLIFSVCLVALPVMGGAIYSAPWLANLGGDAELTQSQLRRHLLRCYVGANPPYAVVANGQIIAEKPEGVMRSTAGPGLIIVRPETAVVTEWMGDVKQIRGPGKTDVKMFERIKEVVDLRPQWANTGSFTASTAEGETVTVKADFRYQIDVNNLNKEQSDNEAKKTNDDAYGNHAKPARTNDENASIGPNLYDAVYRAVYCAGPDGWKKATERTVRNMISDAVNRHQALALFDSLEPTGAIKPSAENQTALKEIAQAATVQANALCRAWGVITLSVEVQDLVAPPVVRSKTQVNVESQSSAQRMRVIGQAEAEFASLNDRLRIEAQKVSLDNYAKTLASNLGDLSAEERARFLDTIGKLATQVAQDRATALRYIDVLETISQNPNARLIVTTGDGPVSFDNH
jgi:regulator of protease activity HflC (stomatin/prohibitin superfamily)